jgi:acetyl-CoA C-acetyltransferase
MEGREEAIMPEAVIVATGRTPIGRAFKGSLIDVRPDDMAGSVIKAVLDKIPELDRSTIDDVMVGCGLTHHEQGHNIGRTAALLAGLPDTVPGTTVNRFCASSLQTIRMAFHAIKAGEGSAFVAAGVESVSRTMNKGFEPDDFNLRFMDENRDDFVNHVYLPMGITAENVAERFGIDRERMDEYAKLSQDRAVDAGTDGFFQREIIPIRLEDGTHLHQDDGPRPGTTTEKLASLPPAFKPDGMVTAGNACPLNDGAAAVIVMSDDRARALGLTPMARIVASSVSGLAPEIMGVGPIEAVGKVLARAGMKIGDVDIVELNEAFAAQVLPVVDELGIDVEDQLNPHGGAIALGHPFGMTGARIMTTLLNGLQTADRTIGLETMCVGGGQGMAMIVERLN